MAILHTWRCLAHGEFQSFNPACPCGCDESMVTKVLGCAISVGKSKDVASMVDRKMADIASQFGVGDLDVRNGRAATPNAFRWNEPADVQRARVNGQTYSVPVDPKADVISQAGVSSDVNLLAGMKKAGALNMKVNIDPRLSDNSSLPEAA
jgi:hypothetical protein